MTFTFWSSYLLLALALFLLGAGWIRPRLGKLALLLLALALTCVPVDGRPLALFVRTYTDDLSISLLVLLAALTLARFDLVRIAPGTGASP